MGRELQNLLTVENGAKLLMLVVFLAIGWAKFDASIAATERRTEALAEEFRQFRDQHDAVTAMAREATIVNATQSGQIATLQQGRDADRVLLMDISSKIAVLLDRTEKASQPKGASP